MKLPKTIGFCGYGPLLALVIGMTLVATPESGGAARSMPCASDRCYLCCPVGKSGKWLELCQAGEGSKGGIGPVALAYRFGRRGRPDLVHPAGGAAGEFKYAEYVRAGVTRIEVRFETAGGSYTLFDYDEHGKRSSGVRAAIGKASEEETEITCRPPAVARLSRLRGRIPCDPESALNLGSCPEAH